MLVSKNNVKLIQEIKLIKESLTEHTEKLERSFTENNLLKEELKLMEDIIEKWKSNDNMNQQSNIISIEEYNRLQHKVRDHKNYIGKLEVQIYNLKAEIEDMQSLIDNKIKAKTDSSVSIVKKEYESAINQ